MRLNLNCRDADIKQINPSEYRITFDLSKMMKPRLSENARMYIEHLNLPEFVDEAFGGINGQLKGYFELRCDNIDSNDFDTEFGNTANNILFTSPLVNFKSFTNNDPMYISNFKINQNFLQNKLSMTLKVYDQWGMPYTTAKTVANEIDETSGNPQFVAYKTAITDLDVLNKEKERVNVILDNADNTLKAEKEKQANALIVLRSVRNVLLNAMDSFLKKNSKGPRNAFKTETLRDLINTFSTNSFIYLFENILPSKYAEEPYDKYALELQAFYKSFLSYNIIKFNTKQLQADRDNIFSSQTVRLGSTALFDPPNLNVMSIVTKKTFNYTVVDLSGSPVKSGTVQLEYFNAPSEGLEYIVVDEIVPNTGIANVLVKNDELLIDTDIESIVPNEYEHFFAKTDNFQPTGVNAAGVANRSRYAIIVKRTGPTYTITFREDLIPSEAFVVGTLITIQGDQLGGVTPANDLKITVNTVSVPPATENYVLPAFIPNEFIKKGPLDIEMQRNNTSLEYTLVSYDFTNTLNYVVGDEVIIPGDRLGGADVLNDATLRVSSVLSDINTYPQDKKSIFHLIPTVEINDTNSEVFDTSGAPNPSAKDFAFFVSSLDGVYDVTFDSSLDASTGFDVDDFIIIKGSTLTGEDGINDLRINITGVTSGKIDTVLKDPTGTYVARYPSNSFGFDVILKLNINTYQVETITGNEFFVGDILTVEGSLVGGTSGVNDIQVEVLSINKANPTDVTGTVGSIDITGVADVKTGNPGQILAVDTVIQGVGKYYPPGEIISYTIDPTSVAVDITSITTPDIKITINEDTFEGFSVIESNITSKYADIDTKKKALVTSNKTYITKLGTYQEQKMKCMNIRLVLYDELPEYTQSTKDAIIGNTYSRLTGCQFKRI